MTKKKKIFIASSSNYISFNSDGSINEERSRKGKLKHIISSLENCGFEPVPWFENSKYWKTGSTILENLIAISKICDGGVFLLGKDNKSTRRKSTKVLYTSNLNVLIELGMFYITQGVNNIFIISDNDKDSTIQIPSDTDGFKIHSMRNTDFELEFKKFFEGNLVEESYEKITFYLDNELVQNQLDKQYSKWRSKALYIGTESGIIWNQIENHNSYGRITSLVDTLFNKSAEKAGSEINQKLHNIDNVISFGTGNGRTDEILIQSIIKNINSNVSYIPVDINHIMIYYASKRMLSLPSKVPFAIVDDFETNFDTIKSIIKSRTHEIGDHNLFSMIGVTFSNLEGNEDNFLIKIKKWMGKNDLFILDALIKNIGYINYKEIYTKILFNNEDKYPNYQKLLLNCVFKKHYKDNINSDIKLNNKDIEIISANPSNYFEIIEVNGNEKLNYTKLEDTIIIECIFKYDGKSSSIFIAKKYEFKSLKRKLEELFEIVYSDSTKELKSNRALFLLSNKNK